MKIAAFGSICIDHFPDQGFSLPGGNSLNFAVHAKRRGTDIVSIAGFIGTDPYADNLETFLKKEQIDTSHLHRLSGNTASNKLYNTPDGERYSNAGDWDNGVKNSGVLTEEEWDYLLSHDIVAVPYWDANLDEMLKRRRQNNLVCVDFMHIDDCGILQGYLSRIDIVFVSPQLANVPALKKMSEENNKLVVTLLGAEGSRAFLKGKEFFQPALKVLKVIDTTGCGDSYQAAFVCSYFLDRDIEKAMLKGAETASKTLAHFGGV